MTSSYVMASIFYIPFIGLWLYLRRKKPKSYQLDQILTPESLPLSFGFIVYLKAFISWIFLFMRTFSIKPGLYFTGKSHDGSLDDKRPLLVTCNNFLTVFLLARRIKPRNVPLLIIDTEGINVWCSSAKGKFSAHEILEKATQAGLLKDGKKITMILPKFSLAGVNLDILKKAGIHPIIGPLYAKDLPAYLDEEKFEDRINDRVHFGLQSRALTALPMVVQFLLYFWGAYIATFGLGRCSMIWSALGLAFSYPILFPYLPGRKFAVKGISLGFLASFLTAIFSFFKGQSSLTIMPPTLFLFATSMFVGLSYTGNSAVSNYSRVRKEIAYFLPIVIMLYLIFIFLWFFF